MSCYWRLNRCIVYVYFYFVPFAAWNIMWATMYKQWSNNLIWLATCRLNDSQFTASQLVLLLTLRLPAQRLTICKFFGLQLTTLNSQSGILQSLDIQLNSLFYLSFKSYVFVWPRHFHLFLFLEKILVEYAGLVQHFQRRLGICRLHDYFQLLWMGWKFQLGYFKPWWNFTVLA